LGSPSFIHIHKNAIPNDVCEILINLFEKRTELQHPGVFGTAGEHVRDGEIKESIDITFHPGFLEDEDFGPVFGDYLLPALLNGLDEYERYYYLGMENVSNMDLSVYFNMQKYPPGGGYKIFHCERAGNQFFPRTLAWMLYLNDIEIGGETEFFYQQHFEKPEGGKLVIWPSDFTHTHRGIIAPKETKYILTGWFQYSEPVVCKIWDSEKGDHQDDTFELNLGGVEKGIHTLVKSKVDDA